MKPVKLLTQDAARSQTPAVVQSTSPIESSGCWRQIGVFGDSSCPELHKYIHCHNCPVHSTAGLQLLNQALPSGYRRERTEYFARENNLHESSSFSAVLFRIQAEWLAVPTRILQEATEFKIIHSLPHRRRGSVLGLANVRGELVICISLPHLLGILNEPPQPAAHLAYHRLLVLQFDGARLAFPVDEVHGPHRFHTDEINRFSARPRTAELASSQAVLRWQDRAIGLLDSEVLLAACQRSLR
jgi:chemotaxis-related protein WspD